MESSMYQHIIQIIQTEILEPINPRITEDIILSDPVFSQALHSAHILKVIQMRIGSTWEKLACILGWQKVKGIDLVCPYRRIALELKNADNTDNSSSRARNIQKLLPWAEKGYTLCYVCINNRASSVSECYQRSDGVWFISGHNALSLLFGHYADFIIQQMRCYCIQQMQASFSCLKNVFTSTC